MRSLAESGTVKRIALVAATSADIRKTVVEGESGLLEICPPHFRPKWEPTNNRLTWPNGCQAFCYTAEKPDRLRGPQHEAALADELAFWKYPRAWDMLMFGLRLGKKPQVCITTTPQPTNQLKSILADPTTVKTGGSTYENREHLAEQFIGQIVTRYEGTRLGRQELYAELLEVLEGVWFNQFDPERHVTAQAEFDPAFPVHVAIDAGTSRHTGAVFFQYREDGGYRVRINVFGDYYAVDQFSTQNAEAIKETVKALTVCPMYREGRFDIVRLDPASSAKTGVGPAAFNEYERVFGKQVTGYWLQHRVADGLDQLEILLGGEGKAPELLIHPRCEHLIRAFNQYTRAEVKGVFQSYPKDPNHPHEDLMDALRGGIRNVMPQGRKIQPRFPKVAAKNFF